MLLKIAVLIRIRFSGAWCFTSQSFPLLYFIFQILSKEGWWLKTTIILVQAMLSIAIAIYLLRSTPTNGFSYSPAVSAQNLKTPPTLCFLKFNAIIAFKHTGNFSHVNSFLLNPSRHNFMKLSWTLLSFSSAMKPLLLIKYPTILYPQSKCLMLQIISPVLFQNRRPARFDINFRFMHFSIEYHH